VRHVISAVDSVECQVYSSRHTCEFAFTSLTLLLGYRERRLVCEIALQQSSEISLESCGPTAG